MDYAIEKKGTDFVVKSDQQDILKFATRRLAIRTIRYARMNDAPPPPPLADAH